LTWPTTIKLIHDFGLPIIGRGLGGVGSGEVHYGLMGSGEYEFGEFNLGVTDNLVLYLYGNFGAIGTLLVPFLTFIGAKLVCSDCKVTQGIGLASGLIVIFGVTTDILEMLSSAIIIGLALAAYMADKEEPNYSRSLNT